MREVDALADQRLQAERGRIEDLDLALEIVLVAEAFLLGDDRMHVAGRAGVVLDADRFAVGARRLCRSLA